MMNDEKMCPLTKMTCYGKECGWWAKDKCGLLVLAQKAEEIDLELYGVRRALEEAL